MEPLLFNINHVENIITNIGLISYNFTNFYNTFGHRLGLPIKLIKFNISIKGYLESNVDALFFGKTGGLVTIGLLCLEIINFILRCSVEHFNYKYIYEVARSGTLGVGIFDLMRSPLEFMLKILIFYRYFTYSRFIFFNNSF